MSKFFVSHIWPTYGRHIVVSIVSAGLLLAFISVATYFYFARDLQSKETIMNRKDAGIILLDRTGEPFFTFYQGKNKSFIPLPEIPRHTQLAVIASEDREFYQHGGFSVRGIVRSLFLNVRNSGITHGGSTITQQLVKNVLLHSQRSFLRKYQEIILASEIERRFTKNEILEMYLNSVYFGSGAFGIEEAAETYFNKRAKDLTISESAILTSLLPAPSAFSPFVRSEKELVDQRSQILKEMLGEQYITKGEMKTSAQEKITLNQERDTINAVAPHFAIMVRNELIKNFGEEVVTRSGFKVKTTLNLEWQKFAEEAVVNHVQTLAPNNATNGAAVVIDPKTGEILVMVGSRSWYNDKFGKFNVTISPRQPGSSFKPIVYAAALERGVITPATILKDEPTTYHDIHSGDYKPVNYDRKFRGPMLPRRALANSFNVPAVEVISKLGVENAIDMAQQMGITTIEKDLSRYGLALVLGAAETKLLDMTSAYSTFANAGRRYSPTAILEITDKFGNSIYKHRPVGTQVVKPETAFLISSFLSDNQARAEAFGPVLNISRTAAVKTGTTDDYKDAWTLGYTPSITIGVWVGNNDGKPMDSVAGSLGAAPIWKTLMEHFLIGTPIEAFAQPSRLTVFEPPITTPTPSISPSITLPGDHKKDSNGKKKD